MAQWYVIGTCMEYIASLDCEAANEEEAIQKWEASFSAFEKGGMIPKVMLHKDSNISDILPFKDGYRHFSGGYSYDSFY